MTAIRRSKPWWRRSRAALASVALLALVLGPVAVDGTLAAWKDSKTSQASFNAAKVPAPVLTAECKYRYPLLGYGRVEIYWRLPEGYQLSDVVVETSTKGLGSLLSPLTGYDVSQNTITNGDGTYTTEVRTNLLGGLLGGGTRINIGLYVEHDSGWKSSSALVESSAGLLAGIGGSCHNLS
ncbi:MAG: hypothetical protein ACTIC1_03500 [Brevibacterium sp.]